MKTAYYTIVCLTALAVSSTLSQQPPPSSPVASPPPAASSGATFSSRLQNIIEQASKPSPEPVLTKFNLDFPGGTPKQLVAAIEKASGRPLNAIVRDEDADTKLPPLKMNNVDVAELFAALASASHKEEVYRHPGGGYSTFIGGCGFKTDGRPSDDSIWSFHVNKPVVQPAPIPRKLCRFYSLASYLDRGLGVDDITTAIETGWKMMGDTSPPTISFHKDTKLLIAVGEEAKLDTIGDVLRALEPPIIGGGGGGFGGTPQPPKAKTPPK